MIEPTYVLPATHIPGHKLVCRRCHRDCEPWPLVRPRACSPKDWAMCIRDAEDCDIVEVRHAH